MEFQITEAIELVKTLAETENLTHTQALTAFFYEADLGIEDAAALKAAFFEDYTLKEMAVDSLTNALHTVFVSGISEESEELSEVDTKETGEGTKYKVRVKDRASNSSYVRYATRQKIAELRANPNISSVELTDHGTTGEDDRGERTSAAKRGDRDGDGNVESSSKEHAGVVHNAIQRKMGGTPDGQDTRKEEVEVEEAMDFKGARREDERREKIQKEKDKKSPSSKDRRLAMGKFRPGASKEERAEGGRDAMREKGTSPKKNGKKMFEAYLKLRADKKKISEESVEEGWKGKHGQSDEEHMDSRSDAAKQISGDSKHSGAEYSHRSYRGVGKPAKPGDRQKHQGKMTDADRNELAIRKDALKKKKKSSIGEDFVTIAASEYFLNEGLNEDGVSELVDILGPINFGELVYEIAEELEEELLFEARAGGVKIDPTTKSGKSVGSLKGGAKTSAIKRLRKKKAEERAGEGEGGKGNLKDSLKSQSKTANSKKEKAKPAVSKAKEKQPKKRGFLDSIANQVNKGMERHRKAMDLAKKTGDVVKKAGKIGGAVAKGAVEGAKDTAKVTKKVSDKLKEEYLMFVVEEYLPEADLVDAGRENQGERENKKITGKGVDNKSSIKLMPSINETVITKHPSKSLSSFSAEANVNESLRAKIQEMGSLLDEECCPECGTPECTCEGKKEEKPKKKKAKIDESGMPILEYSRNNATGPTPEMINPGKDPEGEPGVMNPKGKPKRYKNKGEAPGDRRPNDPSGPELPFDKGTVPNGSGV